MEAANLNPLKLREKNKKEAIWGIFLLKCLSVRKQTKIKGTKIRGSGDLRLTKIAGEQGMFKSKLYIGSSSLYC